jgi:predicted GNAT superfamily acetyltransferase
MTTGDLADVLANHTRFWGERDIRFLHLTAHGGVAHALYRSFAHAAVAQGATRAKAITSVANSGSVVFHRRLGFEAVSAEDYDGRGKPMMVMTRPLPWDS